MKLPDFPECNHVIVQSLAHYSDQALLSAFQRDPSAGKYFTALFCRYSALVYRLIMHTAKSPVQGEYLFALTWRHLLHELSGLALPEDENQPGEKSSLTLQNWIINVTALCINQVMLPEVEAIHYSLREASPPLWCYVERALDRLEPTQRLMVVMAKTFRWSETRIAAYLQAEGEQLSPGDVKARLQFAYQALEAALPKDIQVIYLGAVGSEDLASEAAIDPELENLLSPVAL